MKKTRPTCRDPTTLTPKKTAEKRSFSPWRGRCVIRPIHKYTKILENQGFKVVFSFGGKVISPNEGKDKIYDSWLGFKLLYC